MVNYDTQNGFFVKSNLHKDPIFTENHLAKSEDAAVFKFNNKSGHYKMAQSIGFTVPASISILSILKVRFHHAGNYTCAPSNARSASTSVHVLQGKS